MPNDDQSIRFYRWSIIVFLILAAGFGGFLLGRQYAAGDGFTPAARPTAVLPPSTTPLPRPATTTPGGATPSPTFETSPTLSATAGPSATPLPPSPTVESSPTPAPAAGENLIVNGQFLNYSFEGWSEVNGYWSGIGTHRSIHGPITCSPSGTTFYLQMDRDASSNAWPPPPSEDWAWQDVVAPGPHDFLHLRFEEAQHMHEGIIRLTIYGRHTGGGFDADAWQVVFTVDGPLSAFGSGHCGHGPTEVFPFEIPIADPFDEYRLEVYGHMIDPEDGVLWGDFWLSVE